MEIKIYNEDNLLENDLNRKVIRVKAIIINDRDEVLLGHSHDTYQFIGGHVEEDEDLNIALKREVEEESGIILDSEELIPFFKMLQYEKDYPNPGDNSCYEYYYYYIRTNKLPNLDLVSYTLHEKEGHFKNVFIPLSKLEEVLEENKKISSLTATIAEQNLEAIKVLKKVL